MKFLWTTIQVKDLEKSLDFYQTIVGLNVERRIDYPNGKVIIFLGKGETQVELVYSKDEKVEIGHSISLGFQVESLNEMMDFVVKNGVSIYEGPIEPNTFIKFFYVLDPNGLKIQFAQRSS